MPEAATAAPPPAAPSAPAPAAAPPPAEIHVTAASVTDKGPAPPPPKEGSAQQRMFDDLRKKAGMIKQQQQTAKKSEPAEEPEPQAAEEAEEGQESAPAGQVPAEPQQAKKGKLSPWKLVDEHKAARLKAEQEASELRKQMVDPAKAREMEEKITTLSKQIKEYEDEIRFTNYEKHPEFVEKYRKPYEMAWQRWMKDLSELTVHDDASGEDRPISAGDLLEMVRLPLPRAREAAEMKFGPFANDVMNARKEIRGLFDAQSQALDEARKVGAEREQQLQKQAQERFESVRKEIGTIWEAANKEAVSDEKVAHFFKPVEGDEEGNARLSKGYEMADKAFSSPHPTDPNLTPEQRESIIRLHAAVRNRAAAFGRAVYLNYQLQSKIDALTKELNSFKSAQPGASAGRQPQQQQGKMSAKDSVFAALRQRAR